MKNLVIILSLLSSLAQAQTDPAAACMSLEPGLKWYCYAIQLQDQKPCGRISSGELREQCRQTVRDRDFFCNKIEDPELYEQCRKAALLSS